MNHDFAPTSVEPWQQDDAAANADARAAGALRRWLQRIGLAQRDSWSDGQTPLLNRHGLMVRGERLLERHRDAALALFEFADLLEVRGIYGERVSKALRSKLVAKLRRLAGRQGLAARTGPAQFAVLLPGLDREAAIDAVHRLLGEPCRIEFDAADCDIVLVPEVSVDVCDDEPGSLEALYGRMSVTLARHRDHEERRRVHLRRSRERHSRPAPLEAGAHDATPASLRAA